MQTGAICSLFILTAGKYLFCKLSVLKASLLLLLWHSLYWHQGKKVSQNLFEKSSTVKYTMS